MIAKENIIHQAIYTETLSSYGFIYDFLKVGRNQKKSINIISKTDIIGCFKTNQKNIDTKPSHK
jgi:hypothetical protein